jgi:dTDP-4-dehydrorhamnose reductase
MVATLVDYRLLVLGAAGQVGSQLPFALAPLGRVIALDRTSVDVTNLTSLRDVRRRYRPDVVINAAAYTAVDRAEGEPEVARAVNADAPRVIAEEMESSGGITVHYSTDYVFDGRKSSPYVETDPPAPLSVYGRTKLAGEDAVRASTARHLILRTSWVFGPSGHNFLRTILRLVLERDSLRIVADQQGSPTSSTLIAQVTANALEQLYEAPASDVRWGTYHLTASGATSWHGYARHVVSWLCAHGATSHVSVDAIEAVSSAEYSLPAARPANSRLSTKKIRETFGVMLPDWTVGVETVLGELQPSHER